MQLEAGTPSISYDHFFEGRGVGFEGPITLERDSRLINFPTLLRVGVTNRLELRLGSTVYNFYDTEVARAGTGVPEETTNSSSEGYGGLDVDAKL